MSQPVPVHCRPRAYQIFAEEVLHLEQPSALVRAATAVAMHELDDADPDAVEDTLRLHAEEIRARSNGTPRSLLSHAHQVLFEELGYVGDASDADARGSYLPLVVKRRKGLPVLLSLVYVNVLERLGLHADGLNTPGHFLVRIDVAGDSTIIDPYRRGCLLSREEAYDFLDGRTGVELPRDDSVLQVATRWEWLSRILANLENLFRQAGHRSHLAAMLEMHGLLDRQR